MDVSLARDPSAPAVIERWRGLDARRGRTIIGDEHLAQSLTDILTTRPGERIMRPEYGCDLLDLVDRPLDGELIARLYARVARAIARWEPRVRLQRVRATIERVGHVTLDLHWQVVGSRETRVSRATVRF